MGRQVQSNDKVYDVIVVGGGNAGLCAALRARELGAEVILLEKAPQEKRGGNSFFTGGRMRIPHHGLEDVASLIDLDVAELSHITIDPYPEEQFFSDLQKASRYRIEESIGRMIASRARSGIAWLKSKGARFELPLGFDDIKVNGKIKLIGGDDIQHYEGGPGLVDNLLKNAASAGIPVHYDTAVTQLLVGPFGVEGVGVRTPAGVGTVRGRAVVMACGGFEASPHLRNAYLGPGWDLAKVRGTEFNTGEGLMMAIDIGARAYGHWGGCHSVAADYFASDFGDRRYGDISERVSYRFGITVDRNGNRFFDEGADMRAFTYALSGRNIVESTDGFALQIFDAKTVDELRATYRAFNATKVVSDDLRVIAIENNMDPDKLVATVTEFNKAVVGGEVDFTRLDGRCTTGLSPNKSNWALPIDTPPYVGFPVAPAITFTFGGLRTNTKGEVLDQGERPIRGLYAAGEIVGGIYYHNYAGGSGLVSGLVFGLAAGASAAEYAAGRR
jgi:tricarballylate dehydrogenase